MSGILEKKYSESHQLVIQSVNSNMDSYIRELDRISFTIYQQESLSILNDLSNISDKNSWESIYKKGLLLDSFIAEVYPIDIYSDLYGIYIVNTDCICLKGDQLKKTYQEIVDSDFYQAILNKHGALDFFIVDGYDWFDLPEYSQNTEYLFVARKIINISELSNDLGIIILAIKFEDIQEKFKDFVGKTNGIFAAMDKSGNIIYQSDSEKDNIINKILSYKINGNTQTVLYGKESYLVNQYISDSTGWKFMNIISIKEVNQDLDSINKIISVFIIISMIMAALISIIFSHSITKPIGKFKVFASQIESGVMNAYVDIQSYREFNLLAKTFNIMMDELKRMIHNNYILTIRKQDAELKALQAQINPHFLYNTLNSINALAQIHQTQDIADITYALSDTLRYSIHNTDKMVLISEEVNHVKNYMLIQNIRYNNKIDMNYDIDKDVLEYKTIRLILQPLIENAIIHGLEQKQGLKKISIKGRKEKDKILFQIIDNGIGIPPKKLDDINQYLCNPSYNYVESKPDSINIGIDNVNQRIKLVFGNGFGLKISSKAESGTVCKIVIPAIKSEPMP